MSRPEIVRLNTSSTPAMVGERATAADAFSPIVDRFERALDPSALQQQGTRHVVDVEGVMSIDNGALRLAPLREPGFGRAGLAYGPFSRRPGLAMSVYMLNGHNTSQAENLPEPIWQRIDRWCLGSDASGRWSRLRAWWASGRFRRTLRMFRWWWRLRKSRSVPRIDDNLAVGWFASLAPISPANEGNAFVMRATGAHNGELRLNASRESAPAVHGVPNVPLQLLVVLRSTGAVYFAASSPATRDLPGNDCLRPLGIDDSCADKDVYAVVTQSTMGQIGFRIDTRVYDVRVHVLPEFSHWYASAHAADTLMDARELVDRSADIGGRWESLGGRALCDSRGVGALDAPVLAILRAPDTSGLLHARIYLESVAARAALVWHCRDRNSFFCFEVGTQDCALVQCADGASEIMARVELAATASGTERSVQVLIGDGEIRCFIDGRLAIARSTRTAWESLPVGFRVNSGAVIRMFEAHPRLIRTPAAIRVGNVSIPAGHREIVHERFDGAPRAFALGASDASPGWQRLFGAGVIDITGEGYARVRATPQKPNPGRTAFTIDWADPQFAELGLRFTVPGSDRGQRHKARVGFIAWQDPQNYIMVSTWNSDVYDGGSISSFFHIDGFEDIYDAVWTNVGRRLWWGRTVALRLRFDGDQYLVELDDEPVLYRRLTDVYPSCARLKINKVGLLLNWEWGDDTGSILREFVAKST